jgi:hypothetical protein
MRLTRVVIPSVGKKGNPLGHVRDLTMDYVEGLLLRSWPQLRGTSVRLEELVSMGLPAVQPDPDFF